MAQGELKKVKTPVDRAIADLEKEREKLDKKYQDLVQGHEEEIAELEDQLNCIGHALTPLQQLRRTYMKEEH